MKILLLGANSYIGSRLYLELSKIHEVVGTFYSNKISDKFLHLDITNKKKVLNLIQEQRPDVIIHCANNASKEWCDDHPEEAVKINQEATKYIVEGANITKSKLIYISSFAAITLVTLYGRTKKESEEIIKKVNTDYIIIQPGVVVGLSPKIKKEYGFFSAIMENLDENKFIKYNASKKTQATYIGHICEIIKLSLERNIWNKIIPVATPELKTKYEIARDILAPFGVEVEKDDTSKVSDLKEAVKLSELQVLNLPVYTYKQMIKKIVEEIKNREQFIL